MRRHHVLSGILALVAAAAVGWLLLPGRLGDPGGTAPAPMAVKATAVPCDHSDPGPAPPVTAAAVRPPVPEGASEPVAPAGEAVLRVSLVDAATRLPVTSAVVLWRLGLPEDAEWTAGDVVVARADSGEEPARLEGLAPGRYRAQIPGKRMGSEDPPEFLLEGGTMEMTFPVRVPGKFRAWVRLVDEEGRSLPRAEREQGTRRAWSNSFDIPSWASPRTRRDGTFDIGIGGGAGGSFGRHPSWLSVDAGARGMDLGEFEESSEFRHPSHGVRLRTPAGVRVRVPVSGDLLADTDFVAPAPSREALLRDLPVAEEDLARVVVEAETAAVPVPAGGSPGLWRTIPLEVVATLEGAGRWKRTLTLDGGESAWEEVVEEQEKGR